MSIRVLVFKPIVRNELNKTSYKPISLLMPLFGGCQNPFNREENPCRIVWQFAQVCGEIRLRIQSFLSLKSRTVYLPDISSS